MAFLLGWPRARAQQHYRLVLATWVAAGLGTVAFVELKQLGAWAGLEPTEATPPPNGSARRQCSSGTRSPVGSPRWGLPHKSAFQSRPGTPGLGSISRSHHRAQGACYPALRMKAPGWESNPPKPGMWWK